MYTDSDTDALQLVLKLDIIQVCVPVCSSIQYRTRGSHAFSCLVDFYKAFGKVS